MAQVEDPKSPAFPKSVFFIPSEFSILKVINLSMH